MNLATYRQVLGMRALRHEEFKEGCKAACNGPYDGMWSKTMMGYDAEVRRQGFACPSRIVTGPLRERR